jgi:hypothetical protein
MRPLARFGKPPGHYAGIPGEDTAKVYVLEGKRAELESATDPEPAQLEAAQ